MRLNPLKKKSFIDQAAEVAESLLPSLEAAVDAAREKAAPLLSEAREHAAPILAQGRAIASEKAASAAESAAPLVAQGRARAVSGVASARAATVSAVDSLRAEPIKTKKKGSTMKKLLLLGGLAVAGALVWKKLSSSDDNWQTSYTPAAPAPSEPSTASEPAAAEPAASSQVVFGSTSAADTLPAAPAVEPEQVEQPQAAPLHLVDAQDGSAYGAGSALPQEDGSAPDASYTVKGNADSMLFHTSESPWFNQTRAEVWFTTPEAAEGAGFRAWNADRR